MKYSIVIPAYNEGDKITSTLTSVMNFMVGFGNDFEVLVVDDGSVDNTAQLVKDYSKDNPKVKLVQNKHMGKGPAVSTGVKKATGDFIYLCDADLASPISELKKLSIWMNEHDYDIVIASREGTGAVRVDEPFYRHLMGRVFNLWVRFFTLPGIKDSQCGFKLFRASVAKEVFSDLIIYKMDSSEIKKAYLGAFDVEVLYIAKKRGYKIKELPVVWNYVRTTRLNVLSDSLNMAFDVLRIRFNGLLGLYNKSTKKKNTNTNKE